MYKMEIIIGKYSIQFLLEIEITAVCGGKKKRQGIMLVLLYKNAFDRVIDFVNFLLYCLFNTHELFID